MKWRALGSLLAAMMIPGLLVAAGYRMAVKSDGALFVVSLALGAAVGLVALYQPRWSSPSASDPSRSGSTPPSSS
jgi:hypothetical protein